MLNKIFVLSDIHMGTEFPTVWYRKEFHEPYLISVLDYIIKRADTVREVILLGDIFDFWLYPPGVMIPTMDMIIDANPRILGKNGKMSELLKSLGGNVSYIPGNHDMNVTQEDLNKIGGPEDYKIKLRSIVYSPDPKVVFTHGHAFTLFNAPDFHTGLKPLPIGYFTSRAYAKGLMKILKPGQTVADLANQGYPSSLDIGALEDAIWNSFPTENLTNVYINYIAEISGMTLDEPINTDHQEVNLAQVKSLYYNLWNEWVTTFGKRNTIQSARADYDGTFMAWFAQVYCIEQKYDLMIMGHTHAAKSGLNDGMINYVNSGFMCPSKVDFPEKPITFVEVNMDDYKTKLMKIHKDHTFEEMAFPKDNAVVTPGNDYSCYISIENQSNSTLFRTSEAKANFGSYVTVVPSKIEPGQTGSFWLQNNITIPLLGMTLTKLSDGEVTYTSDNRNITYSYYCNKLLYNDAFPSPLKSKVNSDDWKYIPASAGHPFFVHFIKENEEDLTVIVSPWVIGQEYKAGEVVYYNGVGYIANKTHVARAGLEPPNSLEYWQRKSQ